MEGVVFGCDDVVSPQKEDVGKYLSVLTEKTKKKVHRPSRSRVFADFGTLVALSQLDQDIIICSISIVIFRRQPAFFGFDPRATACSKMFTLEMIGVPGSCQNVVPGDRVFTGNEHVRRTWRMKTPANRDTNRSRNVPHVPKRWMFGTLILRSAPRFDVFDA